MSKKKYELNVELKDIPTEDLVKMVREVVIYEPDLEDIVFYDNDEEYFDKFYSHPFSAVCGTCHSEYSIDDDYADWLAIADLEYKHLFREVK